MQIVLVLMVFIAENIKFEGSEGDSGLSRWSRRRDFEDGIAFKAVNNMDTLHIFLIVWCFICKSVSIRSII